MNKGLMVVIGMSIAYAASFMGLIFAWIHYRRRKSDTERNSGERDEP